MVKKFVNDSGGEIMRADWLLDLVKTFVNDSGGEVNAGALGSYLLKTVDYAKLKVAYGSLRGFVESFPQHFVISNGIDFGTSGKNGDFVVALMAAPAVVTQPAARPVVLQPAARSVVTISDEKVELIDSIKDWMKDSGGPVNATQLGQYVRKKVDYGQFKVDYGSLRGFLELFPQTFKIDEESPHFLVTLIEDDVTPGSELLDHVKDIVRDWHDTNGGPISSCELGDCLSTSSALSQLKNDHGRLRDFVDAYPQHFVVSSSPKPPHFMVGLVGSKATLLARRDVAVSKM
jgi:hypothetical protein